MRKKECSLSNFDRTIRARIEDDKWDNFIANQVIHLKHEQSKRRLQLSLVPVIIITATTIFFSGNFFTNQLEPGNQIAKKKEQRQKRRPHQKESPSRQYDFNNNNQDYIIETVFTQFQ